LEEDELGFKKPEDKNEPKLLSLIKKDSNLNEDGAKMLQLIKKESQMHKSGSDSDESDLEGEDSSEEEKEVTNTRSRYVENYDNDIDANEEFNIQPNKYAQPTIQKMGSNSSDLFADTPTSNPNKRSHQDDVFESGSYKRSKYE